MGTLVTSCNYLVTKPARWGSGESVRIGVGRPGIHSLSRVIPKDFKKWYSQLPCLALSIKRDNVKNKLACLLCPWIRHLTGRPHLCEADRWPTRTSPDYNCEVTNPACRRKTTLGYPPVAARLVGGGATSH